MGLVIGRDVKTESPIILDEAHRTKGTYIIGKTGSGKTTLIESLVVQDMHAGHGVLVIDPHDSLIPRLLLQVPPEREQDVVVLDPLDFEFPFGINILDSGAPFHPVVSDRVVDSVIDLFEKLWGEEGTSGTSWGPVIEQFLRNTARLLLEAQGYTLLEIPLLLSDSAFRAGLLPLLKHRQAKQFFRWFESQGKQQSVLTSSTQNKLDQILGHTILQNIVGQTQSTLDFSRFMEESKIVFVSLDVGQVGEQMVEALGSLIVTQVLNAALARSSSSPQPFMLYADEFQKFATPTFATMLAEARKKGLCTTIAHQYLAQLRNPKVRDAARNVGTLITFNVIGDDAEELGKEFDRTPPNPEVMRHEPHRIVPRNPLEHLVKTGHRNPAVNDLVKDCWLDVIYNFVTGDQGHPRRPHHGVSPVNAYLITVMERGRLTKKDAREFLLPVVVSMQGIAGFSPIRGIRHDSSDHLRRVFDAIIDGDEPGTQVALSAFRAEREAYWHDEMVRKAVDKMENDQDHSRLLYSARGGYYARGKLTSEEHTALRESLTGAARNEAEAQVANAENLIRDFLDLAIALVADPILVNSHQWNAVPERPDTFGNRQAGTANQLIGLPNFRAKAKLPSDSGPAEFDVHTPAWAPATETPDRLNRVSRIRQATRDSYCRTRQEVEEEIDRRQGVVLQDEGHRSTEAAVGSLRTKRSVPYESP